MESTDSTNEGNPVNNVTNTEGRPPLNNKNSSSSKSIYAFHSKRSKDEYQEVISWKRSKFYNNYGNSAAAAAATTTPSSKDSHYRTSVDDTNMSFDRIVHAATGDDIFNTSMSTINTLQLEAERGDGGPNKKADPEGERLEENYDDDDPENPPVLRQEQQQEAPAPGPGPMQKEDDRSIAMNTTCPEDSFDSIVGVGNPNYSRNAVKSDRHNRNHRSRNRNAATPHTKTPNTPPSSRKCNRCFRLLTVVAFLLIGVTVAATVFIIMGYMKKDEQQNPSTAAVATQEEGNLADTTTWWPTASPTDFPTSSPTSEPTNSPTQGPTNSPSSEPSNFPTQGPTISPTQRPSMAPSTIPTVFVTSTAAPSSVPTVSAPTTAAPTEAPSLGPTNNPTANPTRDVDLSDSVLLPYLLEVVQDPQTLQDISTPQGRALEWLEYEDETDLIIWNIIIEGEEDDANSAFTALEIQQAMRQLYQRFAMLTMDFALNDNLQQAQWTFSKLSECMSSGVTCNNQGQVREINWARKNLTGTIPAELGMLSDLRRLDLAQNRLKGSLEPLYKLRMTREIYLFSNELSGELDLQLEALQNLTHFMVNDNQLTGTLPALQMRRLETFNVQNNQLSGSIPSDMVLRRCKYFDLSLNKFSSSIPVNFADIVPHIRTLYLGNNELTGSVPFEFSALGRGRVLQIALNDNFLTEYPSTHTTTKFLTNLDLSNNLFTSRLAAMCDASVFEYGELVELRADCHICNCYRICRTCYDNIAHLYEYDDDWQFDDDSLFVDGDDTAVGDDDWQGDDDDGAAAQDDDWADDDDGAIADDDDDGVEDVVATENTTPQENTQPEDDNARPEEQFIQLEQEEETGDDDGNSIPQQQQQQQHVPPPQEDDDGDDDDDMIDIGRPINVDLEKSPADSVRPATDDVFQDDIFRDDDDGANFEPV